MVTPHHPIGCGQKPAPDETEKWEHWRWIADNVPQFHCAWNVEDCARLAQTCKWDATDGLFHKRCLQREGFIW